MPPLSRPPPTCHVYCYAICSFYVIIAAAVHALRAMLMILICHAADAACQPAAVADAARALRTRLCAMPAMRYLKFAAPRRARVALPLPRAYDVTMRVYDVRARQDAKMLMLR